MRSQQLMIAALAWALAGVTTASAQPGRGDRGGDRGENSDRGRGDRGRSDRGGGGERGGWGGGGGGPGGFIARMDANGNGMIDPEEMQGRARGFLERMAGDGAFDLSRPIPIEKLESAMREQFNRGGEGEGRDRNRDRDRDRDRDRSRENEAAPAAAPLTPGFGASFGDLVLGFGVAPPVPAAQEAAGQPPTEQPQLDDRMRGWADATLKQNDKNGNGVLDKDEWGGLRGDPNETDANKDGRITREEIEARLAEFSRGRGGDRGGRRDWGGGGWAGGPGGGGPGGGFGGPGGGGGGPGGGGPGGGGPGGGENGRGGGENGRRGGENGDDEGEAAAETRPKSYRFRTAAERLPAGLSPDFTTRDRDGDGQISMHEFSTTWSAGKVREFFDLDRNSDGVITPDEYMADKTASARGGPGRDRSR